MVNFRIWVISFAYISLLLSGCEKLAPYDQHDPSLGLKKEAYEKNLLRPPRPQFKIKAQPVEKTPVLPPIPLKFKRPVSLSVTEEISLKDVFLNLAQQAQVNISVSSNLEGGLTFYAQKRPLIDVVREICEMSGLRYRFHKNSLRIEADRPYVKNYNIQFLTLNRQNRNRLNVATDVFANGESEKSALDNGSSTVLTGESGVNFWSELDRTLKTLILGSEKLEGPSSSYAIHKQAGLIMVFATEAQHKQVKQYLDLLRTCVSSQVLIEAKIVEVNLKDEFKSGINWNSIQGDFVIQAPLGGIATPGPLDRTVTPLRDVFTLGGSGNHLTGLLSLIKRFGTLRTLSSPRMTVMNNQPAVLKVATNQVYFRINYHRETGFENDRKEENVSSQLKTVPIGLVMVVQPAINLQTGSIIMTLRPTLSRIVDQVEDPAVGILSNQTQKSFIPQVQVREFDSVIQMYSGETVILGGLMEERANNEESGIPEISDVPLVGNLFKGKSNEHTVTELVIFLKATIIDSQGKTVNMVEESSVSPADEHLYKTFTQDPRPLKISNGQNLM